MDKMQKAIISLLSSDGVFYASMVMQMQRVDGSDLPESALAAVSVQNGRIRLHVDPPRLEKFSIEEVAKIMEHEINHLVMEHLTRLGSRHPLLWNIATDLSINCIIPGMTMGLIPGKEPYSDFPPGKTADFYYALIQDKLKKMSVTMNADGSITIKDEKTGKEYRVTPSGDHSHWKDIGDGDPVTREIIKQAVAEAVRQTQKSQGKLPAGLEDYIKELLGKEQVNWRKLLKQYVGNAVKSDRHYTWKRESKRYGADQKGKSPTRILDIAIGIDTSGSISSEDLAEFMTEIYGIQKSYKSSITIVECDAEVQKVYQLKKHGKVDPKFKGRGGTDLRQIFEYFGERRKKPALLVVLTDLATPFPDKETIRTVWVRCSSSNVETVPFGRLLPLDKPKK